MGACRWPCLPVAVPAGGRAYLPCVPAGGRAFLSAAWPYLAAARPSRARSARSAGSLSWLARRILPSAATPAANAIAAEKPGKVVGAGRDQDS